MLKPCFSRTFLRAERLSPGLYLQLHLNKTFLHLSYRLVIDFPPALLDRVDRVSEKPT